MQVSSRARLAWANRNIEKAADIIVAEEFRLIAKQIENGTVKVEWIADALIETADDLDPEGELYTDLDDIEMDCGDSYCHICGDPGDLFDDLEEED